MKNKILNLIILFICSVMVMGCVTTEPYNPFKVSKEEIQQDVKIIAMTPTKLAVKMKREKEVAVEFEAILKEEFEKAGYKVIPSEEYAKIWDPLVEQAGGFFDAVSGEFDEEKYDSIRDIAKKEFSANNKFDAFLNHRIVFVKASWNANHSSWHGTTEATTGKEGFWAAMTAPNAYGTIPAYSLLVGLTDTSDNIMFADFGGIQLASHVSGGRFVDVPEQDLFIDPEKNKNAALIATSALLRNAE